MMSSPAVGKNCYEYEVGFNALTHKPEWTKGKPRELNEETVLHTLKTVEQNIESLAADLKTIEFVEQIYPQWMQTQPTALGSQLSMRQVYQDSEMMTSIKSKYSHITQKLFIIYSKQEFAESSKSTIKDVGPQAKEEKPQDEIEEDDEFVDVEFEPTQTSSAISQSQKAVEEDDEFVDAGLDVEFVPRLKKPVRDLSKASTGVFWSKLESHEKKIALERQDPANDGLLTERLFYLSMLNRTSSYVNTSQPLLRLGLPLVIKNEEAVWAALSRISARWKEDGWDSSEIDNLISGNQVTPSILYDCYDGSDSIRVGLKEIQLSDISITEVLLQLNQITDLPVFNLTPDQIKGLYPLVAEMNEKVLFAQNLQLISSKTILLEQLIGASAKTLPSEVQVLLMYVLALLAMQIRAVEIDERYRMQIKDNSNSVWANKILKWGLSVSEKAPKRVFNFLLKQIMSFPVYDEEAALDKQISKITAQLKKLADLRSAELEEKLKFYQELKSIAVTPKRKAYIQFVYGIFGKLFDFSVETILERHHVQEYLPFLKALHSYSIALQQYSLTCDARPKDEKMHIKAQQKLIRKINKLLTVGMRTLRFFGKEMNSTPEYLTCASTLDKFMTNAQIPTSLMEGNFFKWLGCEIKKHLPE